MKKYTKDTVRKYIWGEDIENFSIEELEDDTNFMIDVLKYSRDENMFDYASGYVKADYDYVKAAVEIFKDKHDFVYKITNEYINSMYALNTWVVELLLIASSTFDKDSNEFFEFRLKLETMAIKEDGLQEIDKEILMEEVDTDPGEGFAGTYESYKDSTIALDFFAERLIDRIIERDSISLEELFHKKFKSPDEINKARSYAVITEFVNSYDHALGDYVIVHQNVLNAYIKEIGRYKRNWNFYIKKRDKEMYSLMYEAVDEYMFIQEVNEFDIDEIVDYIAKELGVYRKLKSVFPDGDVDPTWNQHEEDDGFIDDIVLRPFGKEYFSTTEYLHYLNIKKIMIETLGLQKKFKVQELKKNDTSSCKGTGAKIIEFKPKTR